MKKSQVLREAMSLMRRASKADVEPHWQEGETLDEVIHAMRSLLSAIRVDKATRAEKLTKRVN